jgi:hypothetical protein
VTATLRYFDARSEQIVERPVVSDADVLAAVESAAHSQTDRGRAAVEVQRADGSSLTFAADSERAALIWIDGLGQPFPSTDGEPGLALVFDYFGSWSEVPCEYTLSVPTALAALVRFATDGDVSGLAFAPD